MGRVVDAKTGLIEGFPSVLTRSEAALLAAARVYKKAPNPETEAVLLRAAAALEG